MDTLESGVKKFLYAERVAFLSVVILAVTIGSATTSKFYTTNSTLENPADALSFIPADILNVPIAGDVEDALNEESSSETSTGAVTEEPIEDNSNADVPSSSETSIAPATTSSTAKTTTYTTSQATATASAVKTAAKTGSNIDWSIIHVDDNGENFDENPITPIPSQNAGQDSNAEPAQPAAPTAPSTPQTPESSEADASSETGTGSSNE